MNTFLFEFQLPVFLKFFAQLPAVFWGILAALGFVLLFLPEGGSKAKQTGDGETADKDADAPAQTADRRRALQLFALGLLFVVVGLIGIGVGMLQFDETQTQAWGELSDAVRAVDVDELGDDPSTLMMLQMSLSNISGGAGGADFRDTRAVAVADVISDRIAAVRETEAGTPERGEAMQALRAELNVAQQPMTRDQAPLKPVRVPSYGVMIMIGFICAIVIIYLRSRAWGIDPNVIIDIGIVAMVTGILGARIWHVIEYWSEAYAVDIMTQEPRSLGESLGQAVAIWNGGLVFYGGLIGGTIGVLTYLWINRLPMLFYLDVVGLVTPLAHAFGRIGCFLNGCCWGGACTVDNPLRTYYPHSLDIPTETGFETVHRLGDPVLMSQFSASLSLILVWGLVTFYFTKLANNRGETFFIFVGLYGLSRLLNQGCAPTCRPTRRSCRVRSGSRSSASWCRWGSGRTCGSVGGICCRRARPGSRWSARASAAGRSKPSLPDVAGTATQEDPAAPDANGRGRPSVPGGGTTPSRSSAVAGRSARCGPRGPAAAVS
jgi:prolipoprotein diacylglyceryltransferase